MKVTLDTAISLLLKGDLVALPTETVYGLAARVDCVQAIENIFKIKKRPSFDPLILHCYNKKQALNYFFKASILVHKLLDAFSPGPLTVVAKKQKHVSDLVTASKQTLAIRIPQHPIIRRVLQQLPVPLVAPSANLYGTVSPVTAQHVMQSFSQTLAILDGGPSEQGLESTIVYPDINKQKLYILRPGMITKQDLESFIKKEAPDLTLETQAPHSFQNAPGSSSSHYKSKAPLYILKTDHNKHKAQNFLLQKFPKHKHKELLLDASPQISARRLYAQMRDLSVGDKSLIFVYQNQNNSEGLWTAIWDRLHKAASGFYDIDNI